MRRAKTYTDIRLEKIVNGGQALGTLDDGRKAFVWGGLPGEVVNIRETKRKSKFIEGFVTDINTTSPDRVVPRDPESYLSTSPWQIMTPNSEQRHKSTLIKGAFDLHGVVLPGVIEVYSNDIDYGYRNKIEFSWYGHESDGVEQLDLAFYRRASKGKIPIHHTSLARPEINILAQAVRDLLRTKPIAARNLKTLLIRCDQEGNCVWQLYLKDKITNIITPQEAEKLPARGGEVIYSDPRSPASQISERLANFGETTLTDSIIGITFRYATEGFFQINIPIYEKALQDIRQWITGVDNGIKALDLYAGVGSIGLTVGGNDCTLVEINESAVREMRRNIAYLGSHARAVHAPTEQALEYITNEQVVIVDPPRAGLHPDVIARLLETHPQRIIYLSCNPVTQARDIALLDQDYAIRAHYGYNFFPRTPHIEHLVVLDPKKD